MKNRFPRPPRAAALVAVLAVVSMLSMILVAFALSARMEQQCASHHQARTKANLFANEGIEYVKGTIQYATGTGRKWVASPGQIISSTTRISDADSEVLALYSALADETIPLNDPLAAPDLNRKSISDEGQCLIDPLGGAPMRVGWIYVRRNGEREASQHPDLSNQENPVVGRFAYWTDDESARINLNTAWKRAGNDVPPCHPSSINLPVIGGMTPSLAQLVHERAVVTPFRTPFEASILDPNLAGTLSTNRFSTTYLAHSSALNPWGEPKIVLTTKESNLPREILDRTDRSKFFLDILTAPSADPGNWQSIDYAKLSNVLNQIIQNLKRSDWPFGSGSFHSRYGNNEQNTAQIALDIIEYVRCAEASGADFRIVQPIRIRRSGSGFIEAGSTADPDVITGATRRPMITEMGVTCGPVRITNTANGNKAFDWTITIEICIPKRYGLTPADLNGNQLTVTASFPIPGVTDPRYRYALNATTAAIDSSNTTYTETPDYWFAAVTKSGTYAGAVNGITGMSPLLYSPTEVWLRAKLHPPGTSGNFYIEIVPNFLSQSPINFEDERTYYIWCPVDAALSVQVNDPRINRYRSNWVQGNRTFGSKNTLWATRITASPQQDTVGNSSSDPVSEASLRQPPFAGDLGNRFGAVGSVAELGNITTGTAVNVPWRSIRLQPSPDETTNSLPDWAIVDLFTPPFLPNLNVELYRPYPHGLAGRIGLNAAIQPFSEIERITGLRALLEGLPGFSAAERQAVIQHLLSKTLATGGRDFGKSKTFVSAGELAEIRGIADTGEASEQKLAGLVDLATVQSNVFRVYSVGQAVKQTPNGRLVVRAEKSVMALLERQESGMMKVVYWKADAM